MMAAGGKRPHLRDELRFERDELRFECHGRCDDRRLLQPNVARFQPCFIQKCLVCLSVEACTPNAHLIFGAPVAGTTVIAFRVKLVASAAVFNFVNWRQIVDERSRSRRKRQSHAGRATCAAARGLRFAARARLFGL